MLLMRLARPLLRSAVLALGIAVTTASGATTEGPTRVLSRLAQPHFGSQSAPTALQARSLTASLEETRRVLDETRRKIALRLDPSAEVTLLEGERARLAHLDQQLEAWFADAEAKLRRAGLSDKLRALDLFRRNYRDRMRALQT